jgi:hypothetical protein
MRLCPHCLIALGGLIWPGREPDDRPAAKFAAKLVARCNDFDWSARHQRRAGRCCGSMSTLMLRANATLSCDEASALTS